MVVDEERSFGDGFIEEEEKGELKKKKMPSGDDALYIPSRDWGDER